MAETREVQGQGMGRNTDQRRKTILVVDDEATIRNILIEVLKLQGYRVLSATNGREALTLCEQQPGKIDVLITDLCMPIMGGEELIVRATPLRPEMKTICLSAAFTKVSLAQWVLFLPKPFSIRALTAMVRGVLDGTLRKETQVG